MLTEKYSTFHLPWDKKCLDDLPSIVYSTDGHENFIFNIENSSKALDCWMIFIERLTPRKSNPDGPAIVETRLLATDFRFSNRHYSPPNGARESKILWELRTISNGILRFFFEKIDLPTVFSFYHLSMGAKVIRNESTDLKFFTVVRVEVPDTVIQKKSEKFFRHKNFL